MRAQPALLLAFIFVSTSLSCMAQQTNASSPIATWALLRETIAQDSLWFGSALGATADTIVGGAWRYEYQNEYGGGAAWVFSKHGPLWKDSVETAMLTPSDPAVVAEFGWAVAVSGDTIAVGAPGKEAIYIFQKPSGGWTDTHEIARLTPSNGVLGDAFGQAVAISGDTIVVGSRLATAGGNQYQGTAYVYVKPPGGWTDMTETAQINEASGRYEDEFGWSVTIQNDVIVVGAVQPLFANSGSAYVFVKPASGWSTMTETAKLFPSDGTQENDWFGASVGIDGNTIAVGAPLARLERGSVYVFTQPAGGWKDASETAELRSPAVGDIGNSVAVNGTRIFVGTSGYPDGAVLVYDQPAAGWISNSHPDERLRWYNGHFNAFGAPLAAVGNTLVVGASLAPLEFNYQRGLVTVLNDIP